MRSFRGAVFGSIVALSTLACGEAGPPPAAPGAPIDPPRQNEDLAKMMEATPSRESEPPAPEPPPSASTQPAPSSSAPAKK